MKYRNIVSCQFSTKAVRGMHFHQDPEIIYVLDGTLEVDYEDSSHFLRTDDFMLINSNVRHEYHSDGDVLLGSVFIDHAMLTEIFGGEELCFWCNSAEEKSAGYDKMRYYIRLIFNYYQTTEGQGIALKNSIFYQLIYLITTDFIVKKGMLHYDSAQWNKDARMNEIMNFIMTNYSEPITLKELSERLYLSNTYLSKYIKQNFGMSFLKLLNNIRLEHAVSDLLYTDKTVLKIAMENGFSNQAGFNHAFKESYHTTPAEYRQQMQGKRSQTGHGETDKNVMDRVEQYLISNFVEPPDVEDSTVMTVDVDADHREILERRWCRLINIGRASDLMRFDVREQVRMLKENLHFEYVRFWGILSRDMMVELKEHNTRYNFKAIDQVFDFLVGLSLKPHVELGFKDNEIFGKIDPEMLKKPGATPWMSCGKTGPFWKRSSNI